MRIILAIDAGGTSTRAAAIDASGRVFGVGRAASGNPTSAGIVGAVDGIGMAAERALEAAGVRPAEGSSALVALAGANTSAFREQLRDRLAVLGFTAAPTIESDLLGTYFSGTYEQHGYALISGTGAVAARVADGRLEQVSGGTGWLLGDAGSGFWIGHEVVRAVAGDLDGQGPRTALTGMLATALELESVHEFENGRPVLLDRLIEELYALRPVEMSRFAPLAFAAAGDAVADDIVGAAIRELVDLLGVVLDGAHDSNAAGSVVVAGPIVLGGSVLKQGILGSGRADVAASFTDRLSERAPGAQVVAVSDGLIGAAVLSLRHAGTAVGRETFTSLSGQLAGA